MVMFKKLLTKMRENFKKKHIKRPGTFMQFNDETNAMSDT